MVDATLAAQIRQLAISGRTEKQIAAALSIDGDTVFEALNGFSREVYGDLRLGHDGRFHTRRDEQ